MYGNHNSMLHRRYSPTAEVKIHGNTAMQAKANQLVNSNAMLLQQIQHTKTMIAITKQGLTYNAHHQQQQPAQQCNYQALQWNLAYNAYQQQQHPAPQWKNQTAIDNQTMQWSPGSTCGQLQLFYNS